MKERKRTNLQTLLAILALTILLAACGLSSEAPRTNGRQLEGYILLWHDWVGPESALLSSLLDRFEEIHPGVRVISVAVPPDQLVQTFTERVRAGLGPDLLLVDASLVYELARSGLLKEVGESSDIDISLYLSAALDMVRDGEQLYGLPFSMHTQMLYYNTGLFNSPPAALEEWVARASNEQRVALNANLASAFWGAGAFGGSMFNAQGEWILDQGGFVNWLDYLKTLQATPGFVVDTDLNRLRTMFESGEAAFYIGSSKELPELQAALGEEALGLAVLPMGPNSRPASPILQTSAFAFSRVASTQETDLAGQLVRFMTNLQQQNRLTIQPVGRLPIHTQVRYRQTLSPLVTELAKQSRTATPVTFAHRPIWNALTAGQSEINDLYIQALSGVKPANQMVQQISTIILTTYEVTPEDSSPAVLCPSPTAGEMSEVTLWHTRENEEAAALAQLAENFADLCPGVSLNLVSYRNADVEQQYRRAVLAGDGPDVLLESSRLMSRLAEEGLIRDLSEFVEPGFLQRFIPEAETAMRYNGRLYGLPESVAALALYYNTDLVQDPLLNLNEVPIRVSPERRFALPATFFYAYWGFEPFGGFDINTQTGAILNDEGLLNWLNWLQAAQNQPGMIVTTDFTEAEAMFARGEAAYLVSDPWSLSRMRRELGPDRFRVALLPAGPQGPGSPSLQVEGVMVNANSTTAATAVSVAFGKYLVSSEGLRLFRGTGTHVSALVTVDLSDHPNLNAFREQAKVSTVLPETRRFVTIETLGDRLFESVLVQGQNPEEAVAAFEEAVREANQEEALTEN